jgi:hypothetical protein
VTIVRAIALSTIIKRVLFLLFFFVDLVSGHR